MAEVTTRELFELAELYWNAAGDYYNQDREDITGWDELSPADQGAEAQGMGDLLEELESRGWQKKELQSFEITAPVSFQFTKVEDPRDINLNFHVTDPDSALKRIQDLRKTVDTLLEPTREERFNGVAQAYGNPRQWSDIDDVPTGVKVSDRTGDIYRWDGAVLMFRFHWETDTDFDPWGEDVSDVDGYGPFTEVLKEPENTEGPWDRWEYVPDGVKYQPTTAENSMDNETVYTNRVGKRHWSWRDLNGTYPSTVPGPTVNSWGPFVKAEG
ncbi:hypothetical protein [Nocardia grenadensis]|uniref:hypothetical protein n=1 Tax=Nocardia grenadensis TaxID=931537 RepID=UPI003D75D1F9